MSNQEQKDETIVSWQERMVDTILRMQERGCSENQIRFWFGEQYDRRHKKKEGKNE